jgi:hypothetical protein
MFTKLGNVSVLFTPLLAKHSESFALVDAISIGALFGFHDAWRTRRVL